MLPSESRLGGLQTKNYCEKREKLDTDLNAATVRPMLVEQVEDSPKSKQSAYKGNYSKDDSGMAEPCLVMNAVGITS
jgi:hypothetical protein